MSQIHVTVAAVIEHNEKFLMVEEIDPNIGIVFNQPAGHVELNESIIDAIVREVKEETGLIFNPNSLIGIYSLTPATNNKHYLRFCFTGQVDSPEQLAPIDTDILKAHWFSTDEIKSLVDKHRSGLVMTCINDYLQGKRYPLDLLQSTDQEWL